LYWQTAIELEARSNQLEGKVEVIDARPDAGYAISRLDGIADASDPGAPAAAIRRRGVSSRSFWSQSGCRANVTAQK
jgi:hypothetical protein